MIRARLVDWFWHRVYWAAVRLAGTSPEWVTDLAERAADARIRVWQRSGR